MTIIIPEVLRLWSRQNQGQLLARITADWRPRTTAIMLELLYQCGQRKQGQPSVRTQIDQHLHTSTVILELKTRQDQQAPAMVRTLQGFRRSIITELLHQQCLYAPWRLLLYLASGQLPGRDTSRTMEFLHRDPSWRQIEIIIL